MHLNIQAYQQEIQPPACPSEGDLGKLASATAKDTFMCSCGQMGDKKKGLFFYVPNFTWFNFQL